MSENLWHHALRFLDKYRTDAQTWDVDELYKFADETGILERHKQLLAKPYHDNQVDMKIMYYELIKMLISYERQHHPEQYDATKGVGKIEGYQELTNKLQRYLNQRFIEDIEKIGDQILNLNEININNKFEVFQENLSKFEARMTTMETQNINLEAKNVELEVKVASLQVNNTRLTSEAEESRVSIAQLTQQINLLKEKDIDLAEMVQREETSRSEQFLEQQAVNLAVRDLLQTEKQERILLDERVSFLTETDKIQNDRFEGLDREVEALKNRLGNTDINIQETNISLSGRLSQVEQITVTLEQDLAQKFKQQQAQELEHLTSQIENITININDLGKSAEDNISAVHERLASHDIAIANIYNQDLATLNTRTDILEADMGQVKVDVTNNTANITTNTTNITNNTTNITNNTTNINTMNDSITNIFQTLNNINTRTAEQFDKIEDSLQQHRDSIHVTIKEMTEDNSKIRGIEGLVAILNEGQGGMRADISKLESDLSSLNRITQQFETKVEEVTVLATNIDVHVKAQEQKIEQQAEGDLKEMKEQIADLQEKAANFLSFRQDYAEQMNSQVLILQQQLIQNADEVDNSKKSTKAILDELKDEIQNAAEEFERINAEIEAMKTSVTHVSSNFNEQLEIKLVSNRDDIQAKLGEMDGRIMKNHVDLTSNAEYACNEIRKLKESIDKTSSIFNEQIQINFASTNQNFEDKFAEINNMIKKNVEDIENNKDHVDTDMDRLRETIDKMSLTFGEQIEVNITSNSENFNGKFGDIADKLRKLEEEQINHKDELSNAAEEFESINKALTEFKNDITNVSTSVTEQLNINVVSNKENLENKFGNIDILIKKNADDIANVKDVSTDEMNKLKEALEGLMEEKIEITINQNSENMSGKLQEINDNIKKNQDDIDEKLKINLNFFQSFQSENAKQVERMTRAHDMKVNDLNEEMIKENRAAIEVIEEKMNVLQLNIQVDTSEKVEALQKELDELKKKGKEQFDLIFKFDQDKDNDIKDNVEKIQEDIDVKINQMKESIQIIINNSKDNMLDDMSKEIEGLKALVADLRIKDQDKLSDAIKELDEKIKVVQENIEITVNVAQKDSQDNLDAKLDAIELKLEDVMNKNKENMQFVINLKEENTIQLKIDTEGIKNDLEDKLDQLKITIEDLKNTEKEDHEIVIKLLDEREKQNISNIENMLNEINNKLAQQTDNLQVSIDLSHRNVEGVTLKLVEELRNDLNDLIKKVQEDNAVIVNEQQNKFSEFRNEINLFIEGSQKYSDEILTGKLETLEKRLNELAGKEKENFDIVIQMNQDNGVKAKQDLEKIANDLALIQIIIDDLKDKQKEDINVVIKLSNDKDAKIKEDTEKIIIDFESKINGVNDSINSSLDKEVEELKLLIDTLSNKTSNDYKIFVDMHEQKDNQSADNLNDIKKSLEELENEITALKNKHAEDLNVIFKMNKENDEKVKDIKEQLVLNLEEKINEIRESMNVTINISKDDTVEKLAEIQKSIDDFKSKEAEQIEVVINDLRTKLNDFKQDISINIENNDENLRKQNDELILQIKGLGEKDQDFENKLSNLSIMLEELRKEGATNVEVILKANSENSNKAIIDLNSIKERLDEIDQALDELKKKEAEDYNVIINIQNEKDNQLKEDGDKLRHDIGQKITSLQDVLNVTINSTQKNIEDSIKEQVENIQKDLDAMKQKEAEDIHLAVTGLEEKIRKVQENVEVTINVSQKAAEDNLSGKINDLERELKDMKEKEEDTLEVVIKDLESKMKALKENIEVNINMTQNNYEDTNKKRLDGISKDLQDLKHKTAEDIRILLEKYEEGMKNSNEEAKADVDKEIKEVYQKLEISIEDMRSKNQTEYDEKTKVTQEEISKLYINLQALQKVLDELKEKQKEQDNINIIVNNIDDKMKEQKDNIELQFTVIQQSAEDNLDKKLGDLTVVFEELVKKEKDDFEVCLGLAKQADQDSKDKYGELEKLMIELKNKSQENINFILQLNNENKEKLQAENQDAIRKLNDIVQEINNKLQINIEVNDNNLTERLDELRKQMEEMDKANMDIVIQMDQANKDNTLQALEDKVTQIKEEIQVNINVLNQKYDKGFNDSGIEVSHLVEKLGDLEKKEGFLNNSFTSFSIEIEDKIKGECLGLIGRIEDLEKMKDLITRIEELEKMKGHMSELDDSITYLTPDVASNKESIASLQTFEIRQIKDLEELRKASQEMLIVHRSEVDAKLKELFSMKDSQEEHGKEYKTFVENIMIQLEGLVTQNTEQSSKVVDLDELFKNMDIKLNSLEQADMFLQEAHRTLTERTAHAETEIKRIEGASLALIKDQMKDAEEIKVEIKKVDGKYNPFFDRFEELQSQISQNKGRIDEDTVSISNNTIRIEDINDYLKNLNQKVEINIEDISLNKQHIEKNLGDVTIRLGNFHADIDNNFDDKLEKLNITFTQSLDALSKGEDAKHQKISNTCTMLELDLSSTNEKLEQVKGQLDGLNVQHTETIQQMKEVTVLATNIDVHVKEQQAQQALDTTNYAESIVEVKSFAENLSKDFIILSDRLKTFDEQSRNQGERIMLIELLGDKVDQLTENTKKDKEVIIDNKNTIESLWKEFHIQQEKAVYFDQRIEKEESIRVMSENRAKDELNITIQTNNQALIDLDVKLNKQITELLQNLEDMRQEQANQANNQGSQETRIIESHNTLISRLEKIEISHKETIEKIVSDQSGGLADIQASLEVRLQQLANLSGSQGKQIEDTTAKLAAITADISRDMDTFRQDLQHFKVEEKDERGLIVTRFESRIKEETNTLESHFKSLESRMESFQSTHSSEVSRIEKVEKYIVDRIQEDEELLRRLSHMEHVGLEHDRLLVELGETMGEKTSRIELDLGRFRETQTEQLRSLRTDVENDKQNFWTLLVEIYSAFRGSTLVLKSEGIVRDHQADVLGVYRMVDHYNDRPVYKQDGGENYIYYSATSSSWLVGTVVGHQYGWLRNGTDYAQGKRWIPDLETGWEYRPLTRTSELSNTWCTDDGTLRIESLREVEKVNELLRDMKNAREID